MQIYQWYFLFKIPPFIKILLDMLLFLYSWKIPKVRDAMTFVLIVNAKISLTDFLTNHRKCHMNESQGKCAKNILKLYHTSHTMGLRGFSLWLTFVIIGMYVYIYSHTCECMYVCKHLFIVILSLTSLKIDIQKFNI